MKTLEDLLSVAQAALPSESEANFPTKETFELYKAGYEAGRHETLAEVLPVLEFYAREENWDTECAHYTEETACRENGWNSYDTGQRARDLLEKLK